jgi:hypothetical protein
MLISGSSAVSIHRRSRKTYPWIVYVEIKIDRVGRLRTSILISDSSAVSNSNTVDLSSVRRGSSHDPRSIYSIVSLTCILSCWQREKYSIYRSSTPELLRIIRIKGFYSYEYYIGRQSSSIYSYSTYEYSYAALILVLV